MDLRRENFRRDVPIDTIFSWNVPGSDNDLISSKVDRNTEKHI